MEINGHEKLTGKEIDRACDTRDELGSELKTLKDFEDIMGNREPSKYGWIRKSDLRDEAVKEINNLSEPEYIFGLISELEQRILIKYIKWKNNLTEEDLK